MDLSEEPPPVTRRQVVGFPGSAPVRARVLDIIVKFVPTFVLGASPLWAIGTAPGIFSPSVFSTCMAAAATAGKYLDSVTVLALVVFVSGNAGERSGAKECGPSLWAEEHHHAW